MYDGVSATYRLYACLAYFRQQAPLIGSLVFFAGVSLIMVVLAATIGGGGTAVVL